MGWAIMYGICGACKTPIQFNPRKVPSIRINNVREPLCRACANRWIQLHPDANIGIEPDAYEAIPEEEL